MFVTATDLQTSRAYPITVVNPTPRRRHKQCLEFQHRAAFQDRGPDRSTRSSPVSSASSSARRWPGNLDLTVGSQVSLVAPQELATPAGILPRFKRFTVVGIFKADMHEYDSGLALLPIGKRRHALPAGGQGQRSAAEARPWNRRRGWRTSLKTGSDRRLPRATGRAEHGNFFRALKIRKNRDVHHSAADRRGGDVQRGVDADGGGHGKRRRHRHPAYARDEPGSIMGIFLVQSAFVGVLGTLLGTAAA